jgi:hypothetical protein
MKTKFAIILGLAFYGAIHAQTFANGLVAYYPFDGNANDASGNSNNATVVNAELCNDRFGDANEAYLFNGSSSWLQVTNFWPVVGTNAVTVSCWIYYQGGTPQPYAESTIVNWGGNAVFGNRFEFRLTDNSGLDIQGIASMCLDGGGNASVALASIYTNIWTHVVVVKPLNGGLNDVAFYVNGALVPTMYDPDTSYKFDFVTNDSLTIGRGDSATPARVFDGAIDDVRIYNRALSSAEVQQLYESESSPSINLVKAVTVNFSHLTVGTNYQLQVSTDLNSWTNFGAPFTAASSFMAYSNYWNVPDWNQLFFRLH